MEPIPSGTKTAQFASWKFEEFAAKIRPNCPVVQWVGISRMRRNKIRANNPETIRDEIRQEQRGRVAALQFLSIRAAWTGNAVDDTHCTFGTPTSARHLFKNLCFSLWKQSVPYIGKGNYQKLTLNFALKNSGNRSSHQKLCFDLVRFNEFLKSSTEILLCNHHETYLTFSSYFFRIIIQAVS